MCDNDCGCGSSNCNAPTFFVKPLPSAGVEFTSRKTGEKYLAQPDGDGFSLSIRGLRVSTSPMPRKKIASYIEGIDGKPFNASFFQ